MNDIAFWSAADQVEAFRNKEFSPVDVVTQQLRRIAEHNGAVNAFTLFDEEAALRAATQSEARWSQGKSRGPLDGVSFTAKDNLLVAGYPSRRGSRTTSDAVATESAPIVARCQEAGAVFLGLTTMPEFGMGPVTISPLTGVTRNPWDTTMQSGGSSGGGAAAVAAGFATFSLASDAGGSIRIPAALTGVVGLKPSGGRVPIYPASSAGSLACNGPLTRSVLDAASVLNVASRADARDPLAMPAEGSDYAGALLDSLGRAFKDGRFGGLKDCKIAMSLTLGYARKVHPELSDAVRKAAAGFAELGARVEECDPPVEDPIEPYLVLLKAGFQYAMRNASAQQRSLLAEPQQEILAGPVVSLQDYLAAQEHCQGLARRMHAFHQEHDLLITPTVAWPGFPAERSYPEAFEHLPNRRAWVPFTALFNLTQQPAISIPIGLTVSGLPMGLQIVGARGTEAKILNAAAIFEAAFPFEQHPK